MVHCGSEPTAVDHSFSFCFGPWAAACGALIEAMVFSTLSDLGANPAAKKRRQEAAKRPHGPLAQLVQLGFADEVKSGAA